MAVDWLGIKPRHPVRPSSMLGLGIINHPRSICLESWHVGSDAERHYIQLPNVAVVVAGKVKMGLKVMILQITSCGFNPVAQLLYYIYTARTVCAYSQLSVS